MRVFKIEQPDTGLREVLSALQEEGFTANSRNGPVLRFAEPVCLAYQNPRCRVLSSPVRDANPFFHLVETMWMFAGMQELDPLLLYNAGMAQYSDDGKNLRGTAYGHRWRSYIWRDQLKIAVDSLRANPDDRRVVVTMWDPLELGGTGKDFACNLQVVFSTRPALRKLPSDQGVEPGQYLLDMTVTNRSNDLIYGAMGSNLFHFSMLHEYVALHSGLEMGRYYQVSTNLHLYTENPTAARCFAQRDQIAPDSSAKTPDNTLTKLALTLDPDPIRAYVTAQQGVPEDAYLRTVVMPLVEAYKVFKLKSTTGLQASPAARVGLASELATQCASPQLRAAALSWLQRRAATPGGAL